MTDKYSYRCAKVKRRRTKVRQLFFLKTRKLASQAQSLIPADCVRRLGSAPPQEVLFAPVARQRRGRFERGARLLIAAELVE
jgi:hypothetical protein